MEISISFVVRMLILGGLWKRGCSHEDLQQKVKGKKSMEKKGLVIIRIRIGRKGKERKESKSKVC